MSGKITVIGLVLVSVFMLFTLGFRQQEVSASFLDDLGKIFNPGAYPQPGFTVYENSEHKIKVQYPSDWKKASEVTTGDTFGVTYRSNEPANPSGRALFTILVERTDKSSLEGYRDSRVYDLSNNNLVTNLTSPVDTTLSGTAAYKINFVSSLFGGLNTSEVITMKDGKVYTIAYQAKPVAFEKHLDQFKKIVDSFQLTG